MSCRPCVRGEALVNSAHARAWVFVMAMRKVSGSVIGENLRDWSRLVRSLTDVYVVRSMRSSSCRRAISLPLSIFCRQNGENPRVMFFSSGSNRNWCCFRSLNVSLRSVKLTSALPCCARSRRSSSAWNLAVGSLLLSKIQKISGTSSLIVRLQNPVGCNGLCLAGFLRFSHWFGGRHCYWCCLVVVALQPVQLGMRRL